MFAEHFHPSEAAQTCGPGSRLLLQNWKREQEKQGERITSERNALAEHWLGSLPLHCCTATKSLTRSLALWESFIGSPWYSIVCFSAIFTSYQQICAFFFQKLFQPLFFNLSSCCSPDCRWLSAAQSNTVCSFQKCSPGRRRWAFRTWSQWWGTCPLTAACPLCHQGED